MNQLLISFPDQSKYFTYGVEYGRLLERIERGEQVIENNGFPIRIENEELLIATCDTYGYIPTFQHCEVEGWINFIGLKKVSTDN